MFDFWWAVLESNQWPLPCEAASSSSTGSRCAVCIGEQPSALVTVIVNARVQARLRVIDTRAQPVSQCATRKQRNNQTLDNA
jgi:hypothetical protein